MKTPLRLNSGTVHEAFGSGDVGREVHVRVFLIRPPGPARLRQERAQVLIGGLDGVRRAVGVVRGVVVEHAEVGARLGPDVVGLRRMHAHARVDVVGRVRDLAADAGRAVDQAVDERRLRIHEDRLTATSSWPAASSCGSPSRSRRPFSRRRVSCRSSRSSRPWSAWAVKPPQRQRRGDGQCTGRQLLFHLEHITASDIDQRRWSVPRSEGSERA